MKNWLQWLAAKAVVLQVLAVLRECHQALAALPVCLLVCLRMLAVLQVCRPACLRMLAAVLPCQKA